MSEKKLTTAEAAEFLKRSVPSIHAYVKEGTLKAERVGPGPRPRLFFSPRDLETFRKTLS